MFQLDNQSGKSIYEQVIDHIKELIMTDVLPEDSQLPSVRALSRQLTINPNTVQKAFRELEREGYVFTVAGKGTFVSAKERVACDPGRIQAAQDGVGAAFKELLYLGIDPAEARRLALEAIDALIEENGKEEK